MKSFHYGIEWENILKRNAEIRRAGIADLVTFALVLGIQTASGLAVCSDSRAYDSIDRQFGLLKFKEGYG